MRTESYIRRELPGVLGGVCAGAARAWNVDAGVIRLLFVVIAVLTAGLGAVIYALLWLILPAAERPSDEMRVSAESLSSDTYGRVATSMRTAFGAPPVPEEGMRPAQLSLSIGHMPPPPPPSLACEIPWRPLASISPLASSVGGSPVTSASAASPSFEPGPSQGPARAARSKQAARSFDPSSGEKPTERTARASGGSRLAAGASLVESERFVQAAITALVIVLCVVFVFVFMATMRPHDSFGILPAFIIGFGAARMVLPHSDGSWNVDLFVLGLGVFLVGVFMLLVSLGVLELDLPRWIMESWPLALVGSGLWLIGRAIDSHRMLLASLALLVAFFAVGVTCYSSFDRFMAPDVPLAVDPSPMALGEGEGVA